MAAMMGCSLGLMRHAQKARTFTKNLTRVLLDAMHHELLAWGGGRGVILRLEVTNLLAGGQRRCLCRDFSNC